MGVAVRQGVAIINLKIHVAVGIEKKADSNAVEIFTFV